MTRNPQGAPMTLTRIYKNCKLTGDCRLWKGGLNKGGYPFIYDPAIYAEGSHKSGMIAGRVAVWKIKTGKRAPEGRKLVMTCGNRTCLAHAHMQPMTFVEAQQFAVSQGAYSSLKRRVACVANARKHSKLGRERAGVIKARIDAGESRQALADEYRVDRTTIDQIARGERWKQMAAPNSSVFCMAA